MNINEIREKWVLKENDKQASIDLWNSMARQYETFIMPTFEDDKFLILLDRLGVLNKNARILDVGCGSGRYSLAIADKCKNVTGIDLSPKMLEIAEKLKENMNKTNVHFIQGDWHTFDLEKAGMLHQYDVVFAHMTPAVQSAQTFEKLIAASNGMCAMVKPTRRTDPISDAIKKLAGITERRESSEADIFYAFGLLWLQGYNPIIEYKKEIWDMKKSLEDAYGLYINRVKTYKDLRPKEEETLRNYIRTLSVDGIVHEAVDTTIMTMYWKM